MVDFIELNIKNGCKIFVNINQIQFIADGSDGTIVVVNNENLDVTEQYDLVKEIIENTIAYWNEEKYEN